MKSLLYKLMGVDSKNNHDFVIDWQGEKNELIKELNMLLGSRVRTKFYEENDLLNGTILNYGINESDLKRAGVNINPEDCGNCVIKILTRFEPRLTEIRMRVKKKTNNEILFIMSSLYYGKGIDLACLWDSKKGEVSFNEWID